MLDNAVCSLFFATSSKFLSDTTLAAEAHVQVPSAFLIATSLSAWS